MRIGTWNVEGGVGSRNPDRLAILRERDAAVWVLTETHLALDLSETHVRVSSEPRPGAHDGSSWVTIWSQFPLVRTLPVPDPRRMIAAVFDTRTGALAVAGVVLPWHSDRGDVAGGTRSTAFRGSAATQSRTSGTMSNTSPPEPP